MSGFGTLSELEQNELIDRSGVQAIINTFRGSHAGEQLEDGMNRATECLKKYTSTLSFDPVAAAEIFASVEIWHDSNGELLKKLIRDGAETVPQQLALSLGLDKSRQYVIASFSEAVRGMKAWRGGAVVESVKYGGLLGNDGASQDARSRAVAFANIIKMDQDGQLAQIFSANGASGLGVDPVVTPTVALVVVKAAAWVLAVVGVAAIAAWVVNNQMNRRMEAQNKLIDDLCALDPAGCKDVKKEALRKLQEKDNFPGFSDRFSESIAGTIATYAGIGLLAYLSVKFVFPAAIDAYKKSKEER